MGSAISQVNNKPEVTILAAVRKPGTVGWGGAFVAVKGDDGRITAAVFENNMDYISNEMTEEQIKEAETQFKLDGWLPMTREDIKATAGV